MLPFNYCLASCKLQFKGVRNCFKNQKCAIRISCFVDGQIYMCDNNGF